MSVTRKKSAALLLVLAAGAGSCHADQPRQVAALAPPLAALRPPEAAQQRPAPTDEADTAASPPLASQLRPIQANYRRIKSITNWSATAVRSLDEPGEGGEATFYYAHGQLEKVVARHFGEMGQQRVTYYLLGGRPSFVLEQAYTYNRPIYYDAATSQQAHDTEAFDFDKSAVEESRSYFAHGQLVQQLSNQDCGSPFAADYLREEQKRLLADFQTLLSARRK